MPAVVPRSQAIAGPALVGGLSVAGAVALWVRDPHDAGSWGLCPLLGLTGMYCPACGALRAVNDLTHLEPVAAASSNLLLVALLPLAMIMWGRWVGASWRGAAPGGWPSARTRRLAAFALSGLVLAFTVARNLPAGAWLAP